MLDLVGVEVVTGEGFEPRGISAKVKERMTSVDFGILVVTTEDGESFWTRDEINQLPPGTLIPVVEDGAHFEAGMFGDHEWIPFPPGHISEAFIGILEGIEYFRSQRSG